MSQCSIDGCQQPEYAEGVCRWHYPLWEAWGYDGGYEVYQFQGRVAGRKQFNEWLNNLTHQQIVNILTNYDWHLADAVIQTYSKSQEKHRKRIT